MVKLKKFAVRASVILACDWLILLLGDLGV